MTPEELKKILAESIAPLQSTIEAQAKEIKELKAQKGASLAGPIVDQAMPHVGACNAAADAMEAAGIGTHPTHGHAAVMRRIGASILHGATMGKLPHIFRDHSYLGGDGVEASLQSAVDEAVKKVTEKSAADLKAAQDVVASLKTEMADLKAKAFTQAAQPERKSLDSAVVNLLAKIGVKDEEDGKLTLRKVDELLASAGIKGSQAIAAKLQLQAAGKLAA